jgi:polyhydroxyalkanoate synthesis repressor PhaR
VKKDRTQDEPEDNRINILIKKYENRRLYSASEKRYVTMTEIESYVKKGKKVKVMDAVTEKDITSDILTQILLEQGKAGHIPAEMLEMLIRMNDLWLTQMWAPYITQSYKLFTSMNPFKPFFKNLFRK